MDKVQVERNSAAEPRAVLLRLTPEEADFVEHMYMVAYGMVCGFLAKARGTHCETDVAAVEHGMKAMLRDADNAERVSKLVRAMHAELHHPGETCEQQMGEGEEPDAPEQNWRCN